jgi:anthranilate synthase component 1
VNKAAAPLRAVHTAGSLQNIAADTVRNADASDDGTPAT